MSDPKVSIIMGSDSDLPVMRHAADFLKELGVVFEITIVSAHRTPERMFNFAKEAHRRGKRTQIRCSLDSGSHVGHRFPH